MLRLRQIVLVAQDLRGAENEICDALGLEVCYRDPGLEAFGLRHGLYPIGDRLLEIVAPKRPGTTAERYLRRRGGDGGYMVIAQTDDIDRERARIDAAGIRVIFEAEEAGHGESIRGIHLHPKDVGGAILSIDQADPPESWSWAGHDWRYHARDDVVTDVAAIEIQSDSPGETVAEWETALDRRADGTRLTIDDAEIRFVEDTDGRGPGLGAVDLVAADRARAGETLELCGTRFNLV